MDVSALLFGFSKALYSNWLFYKPDHLLIDCGEGAATTLGNGNYAVERVLLTHGHIDHIAGLPSLIWSRANGMGDNEKPLEIVHPRADPYVEDMKTYLKNTRKRLPFELSWTPLEAGDEFSLPSGRRVQTFVTDHMNSLTLGYKIVETRRKLKPEFAHLTQEELRARAVEAKNAGRDAGLNEEYDAVLGAFGGDGLPLNPDDVRGTELLVHEATLLEAADRKHQKHSTLDEALKVGAQVRPKALLLQHVSGRYTEKELTEAARHSLARHAVEFPVWCLRRNRFTRFTPVEKGES